MHASSAAQDEALRAASGNKRRVIGLACSSKSSLVQRETKAALGLYFYSASKAHVLMMHGKLSRRLILFVRRARGAGRGLAPIDAANGAAASHVKISARSPRGESPFPLFLCRCALTPGCISNLRKLLLTIRIIHKGLPLSVRRTPRRTLCAIRTLSCINCRKFNAPRLFFTAFLLLEIDMANSQP
jgi:hypothetical protein